LREEFAGDGSMQAVRDQDDGKIGVTHQIREMRAGVREAVTAGDSLGALAIYIYNDAAHDFRDRVDRGNVVTLQDSAAADDSQPEPIAHASLR